MADKSSSQPIPEGWRFETKQKKNGSQVSYYFCRETGQRFYTYEDMMRYVNYAKEAGLPMYIPDFPSRKRKITDQSSESADNQIEKSLDSEKGTDIEENLVSKKGFGIEKGSGSEEGTDTESFDSEKTADAGKSDFPKDDPSEISISEADIIPCDDPFIGEQAILVNPPAAENPNPVNLPSEDMDTVEQAPMQAVMVNPPAVENPNPVNLPSEDMDTVDRAPMQAVMVNPPAVENPVNLPSEVPPAQAIMVNPPAVENPNPVNLPSEVPDNVEQAPMQAIMVNPPAVENPNPVNQVPAVRNPRMPMPLRAIPRGGGGIRKPRPRMI